MEYAPGLTAPRCPGSVLVPNMLGGIPSANVKVLVTYLPAYYRKGVAKSYEALKRLFARRPKRRLPLPLRTKNPDKT